MQTDLGHKFSANYNRLQGHDIAYIGGMEREIVYK